MDARKVLEERLRLEVARALRDIRNNGDVISETVALDIQGGELVEITFGGEARETIPVTVKKGKRGNKPDSATESQ